jgi:hypothetical protein
VERSPGEGCPQPLLDLIHVPGLPNAIRSAARIEDDLAVAPDDHKSLRESVVGCFHATVLVQQAGEGQVEDLQPLADALAANLGGVRPWPSDGEGAELGQRMRSLAHVDKEKRSPVLELIVQPSQAAQLAAEDVSAKAPEE